MRLAGVFLALVCLGGAAAGQSPRGGLDDTGVMSKLGKIGVRLPELPSTTKIGDLLRNDPILRAPINKNQLVQIPHDPLGIADGMDGEIQRLATSCRLNHRSCEEAQSLAVTASALRKAAAANPLCPAAAVEFIPYYADSDPPAEVARRFDLACLGSFAPRLDLVGAESVQPAIFRADNPQAGVLSAVAILQVGDTPFCGGLLRKDHSLVTARHCFDAMAEDFRRGRVTARPAAGGAGPWPVSPMPLRTGDGGDAVRNDWVMLKVSTPDAIAAVDTTFQRASPGPVTLVGHYGFWDKTNYAPGAPSAGWQRGLRFPRDGLCQVVKVVDGCVQLACETVRGFSGTPIFVTSHSDGQPYAVVGFISQPNGDATQCYGIDLATSTFAVASDVIH